MKIDSNYNNKNDTKETLFERFILEKQSINLSSKTLQGYISGWTTFLKFEEYKGKYIPLKDITAELLTEYRVFLINHTKANEVTRATYLKNLRTILRNFMEKGYLPEFQVVIPKFSTPIQETYTIEELKQLLQKPSMRKGKFNFVTYRTWVMICYIIDTTNRADTVLGLKIRDLDFENNKITLRRVKSKRPYITPMSSFLKQILLEYLSIRKGNPDNFVFCDYRGNSFKYYGFRSAIVRYNKKRKVNKTSIHCLRHTAAKLFILKGGREFALMELLGHTSLTMSKHYVKLFSDDLNIGFNEKCGLSNFADNLVDKKKIRKD